GVLGYGDNQPKQLSDFFSKAADSAVAATIRQAYSRLGSALKTDFESTQRLKAREEELAETSQRLKAREEELAVNSKRLKDREEELAAIRHEADELKRL